MCCVFLLDILFGLIALFELEDTIFGSDDRPKQRMGCVIAIIVLVVIGIVLDFWVFD